MCIFIVSKSFPLSDAHSVCIYIYPSILRTFIFNDTQIEARLLDVSSLRTDSRGLSERRKETKGKTLWRARISLILILISLLKLLRCFGKYWQYGSKLWKTHFFSSVCFGIVAFVFPASITVAVAVYGSVISYNNHATHSRFHSYVSFSSHLFLLLAIKHANEIMCREFAEYYLTPD